VLANNRVHDNGVCGVYYCLRTTHSICRDNELVENGVDGISVGERDTDHLITGNRFRGNKRAAIGFRRPKVQSGDRVIIKENHFTVDAAGSEHAPIDVCEKMRDIQIIGNQFDSSAGTAIRIGADCERITVVGNVAGPDAAPARVESASATSDQPTGTLPDVSPGSLPPTGAKHLRVASIPAWVDRTR
jgi:hypothetical protein